MKVAIEITCLNGEDLTPRQRLEAAVAAQPVLTCPHHPHIELPVDTAGTVAANARAFVVKSFHCYRRCSSCPHDADAGTQPPYSCAAELSGHGLKDEDGKPLPVDVENRVLSINETPSAALAAWLADSVQSRKVCCHSKETLPTLKQGWLPSQTPVRVEIIYAPCVECALHGIGVAPDDARASFANFVVEPPELSEHLHVCREFAAAPRGVLLLLGNTGTGKTHLAVSIARARWEAGERNLLFLAARRLFAEHFHFVRAGGLHRDGGQGPLAICQAVQLLVLDDLTPPANGMNVEELLLDLLDYRMGCYAPTVITSNLNGQQLEAAFGSRLIDRLRRGAYRILEFGFDSKRAPLNGDYLKRVAHVPPPPPPLSPSIQPRNITETKVRLAAVEEWLDDHRFGTDNDDQARKRHEYMAAQRSTLRAVILGLA